MERDTQKLRRIGTSKGITCERKQFSFELAENNRGRFLKIVETTRKGHDAIIIPTSGLGVFESTLIEMHELSRKTPMRPLIYRE